MIATKTTALMVTMAVLGIVPVAAHAQTVDIQELADQSGTATQTSSPNQEAAAVNEDPDTNTANSVVYATVGFGGTLNAYPTTVLEDSDVLANDQAGQSQFTTPSLTASPTPLSFQAPTFTLGDLPGLIPGG
jgi:hypothetical protein